MIKYHIQETLHVQKRGLKWGPDVIMNSAFKSGPGAGGPLGGLVDVIGKWGPNK